MAFSRQFAPVTAPAGDALTSAMVGIGMGFAAPTAAQPNIEDTLYFASVEAMDREDLRVLAMLVSWFGVHHAWVNADRLTKVVAKHGSRRVQALWTALASWQGKDRRYARLARLCKGPRLDVLATGSDFQIRRHGEDVRFAGTCLRLPANLLRDRPSDVVPPQELSRRHRVYRHRVMMGPTYRADLWAALDAEPELSAANLARRTYASFATAWQAKRDFRIVEPPRRRAPHSARRGTTAPTE